MYMLVWMRVLHSSMCKKGLRCCTHICERYGRMLRSYEGPLNIIHSVITENLSIEHFEPFPLRLNRFFTIYMNSIYPLSYPVGDDLITEYIL